MEKENRNLKAVLLHVASRGLLDDLALPGLDPVNEGSFIWTPSIIIGQLKAANGGALTQTTSVPAYQMPSAAEPWQQPTPSISPSNPPAPYDPNQGLYPQQPSQLAPAVQSSYQPSFGYEQGHQAVQFPTDTQHQQQPAPAYGYGHPAIAPPTVAQANYQQYNGDFDLFEHDEELIAWREDCTRAQFERDGFVAMEG